ncbi:unnamed protein product [Phyllotreta striolata]|uniref:BTB domain-containing protein n=1 Tax=Phyllotreta striolata TaxID=444603 RepID=A0A9N9TIL1_PHYSR|nr:unnamed protein product [Phyllotreta striolata]
MERKVLNSKDRLVSFFKNQQFVDCTFKIDGKEVKAHKLILACSSPVFEKMLFGDMSEDTIEIPDIDLEVFIQTLEHIYTNDIHISSVLNAWNLFYVANKYLLDDLFYKCLKYVRSNLTMNTLVLSYEYAEMYDLSNIKEKCFDDMVKYISGLFFCDYHMKSSTLRAVLGEISSPNLELLVKIIEWSLLECENRQKQVSPGTAVELLKQEKIIEFFKKDCLDFQKFQQINDKLIKDILILLGDQLEWPKEPFDLSISHVIIPKFCQLRKSFKIASRMDLMPNEEFTSDVRVNKKIMIFGLSINTPMVPSSNTKNVFYDGEICIRICLLESQRDVVEPMKFNKLIPYNSPGVYLNFYNLAVLEPDLYNFRISFNNPSDKGTTPLHLCYMSNELLNENKDCLLAFYEVYGTIIQGISFYPY